MKRILTAVLTLSMALFLMCTATFADNALKNHQPTASFTPDQKKAIEGIIRNYLLSNPELLLQVNMKLREKMQQQQTEQAMQAITKNQAALFDDPKNPIAGNPQGNKVLAEFFDYQCPHCKAMGQIVKNLVQKNKDLKVVFFDWPIFGGASDLAAKACLAANKQGKYFQLHEALLTADNPLNEEKIFSLAKAQGINIDQLKKDMEDPSIQERIKNTFNLAQQLNLEGTPAFVLENKKTSAFKFVPGETTEKNLQQLLDQM